LTTSDFLSGRAYHHSANTWLFALYGVLKPLNLLGVP
jgi:hypothetical protein